MKRKGLGLMMATFVAALPVFVNADEVGSEKFTECITATGTKTCTLTENVTVGEQLDVAGNIKLDLNGYSITASETAEISGGLLVVLHGGTLTIEDTKGTGKITTGTNTKVYSPLQMTKKDKTDITKKATLIINGGQFEGYDFVICGNGNPDRINTEVVINGGKLSVISKEGTAIYQPQDGKTIVNGGEIKGATGIEVRSGELEVNGGTIIGTEKPVTVNPNGSGTTSIGAGIAVAQHTTKKAINVVINGGTIQGYSALYQSNPQKNEAEAIAKIQITVKGGKLEAINEGTEVIYSENNRITVEGGSFSEELPEDVATPEGSEVYTVTDSETGETKYVVATEEDLVEAPYVEATEFVSEEDKKELVTELDEILKDIDETIKTLEESENVDEEALAQVKKAKEVYTKLNEIFTEKERTIISVSDIVYGSMLDNNFVVDSNKSTLDKAVKLTLELPENLEKVKEGYTRKYSVIRFHEFEKEDGSYDLEVTELDATEKDGKVSFETDKFSMYILTYKDIANTKNPNTFDGISLYMIIASVSLIGLVSVIAYSKKAKNY